MPDLTREEVERRLAVDNPMCCGCCDDVDSYRDALKTALSLYARAEAAERLAKMEVSPFIEAIAAERRRQLEKEGWSKEHDASEDHANGELALAACYYAYPAETPQRGWERIDILHFLFPISWHPEWAKKRKKDRMRQLVVAGALIVAELDRLAALDKAGEG